jgi:hypothetical protein
MGTAVVAILASSTVALASIAANVWQQRRGFSHDRQMVDLADTRALFDDAAKVLSDAASALGELVRALRAVSSEGFVGEQSPELINALQVAERLRVVKGRLDVRFDQTHAVAGPFSGAYDAALEAIYGVARMAEPDHPTPDPTKDAVEQALDLLFEVDDRLSDVTERFMLAAVATVGPRLD